MKGLKLGLAQARPGGVKAGQRRFVLSVTIPTVLYASIGVFSLVWAFTLMFFRYSPGRVGGPILGLGGTNPFVGLEHFYDMIFDVSKHARHFRTSVVNTLIFAFAVVPLNLAITLPLAALIESVSNRRLRKGFRAIYFLPVVTSQVAVAMMWGYIYDPQAGLLNAIVRFFDGKPIAWLTDPRASYLNVSVAMWAVIGARLWADYGYNLVIFIAALQGIPNNIREAAKMDGANGWQVFSRVTVPLLRPTLLFVSVMTMLDAFQVFDLFQVLTDGGPHPKDPTRVLMLDIYESAFRYERMGWAAATSLILVVIVMTFTLIQMRLLRTEWEY